uniref:Uncharacterized protein n=1 Tax=Anguilla anguilla TaxID=7936 RepID=A0A0E9WUE4_ANGAN
MANGTHISIPKLLSINTVREMEMDQLIFSNNSSCVYLCHAESDCKSKSKIKVAPITLTVVVTLAGHVFLFSFSFIWQWVQMINLNLSYNCSHC